MVAIAAHAVSYNLSICGTQVTDANASDLSVIDGVTGTVTFDPSTNTLTLNNATIVSTGGSNIGNYINGLTINVVGTNTLSTTGNINNTIYWNTISTGSSMIITGSGSLTCTNESQIACRVEGMLAIQGGVKAKFVGDCAGIYGSGETSSSKLIVSGANTQVIANGRLWGSIDQLGGLTLYDGLKITQPAGAFFSSSGGFVSYLTGGIVLDEDVVISNHTAYAIYDANTTTLTFAYGPKPEGAYSLNTGANQPAWYTDGTRSNVTKVVFDPSFADARPTSTFYWFRFMTKLSEIIGLNYLNTSAVTNMQDMFAYCYALTNVDVSAFNTSNVTNMQQLFSACKKLTSLDLRNFNTGKVTNMNSMFWSCEDLATIVVGDDWSTAAVTSSDNMFYGCTNIVGSKGTTYDANHIDKEYARIDGGTSSPGYLSEPSPYAVYDATTTTLTFAYGIKPAGAYILNKGTNQPAWYTDGTYANVIKVVFDPSFAEARPKSTFYWFRFMTKLSEIIGLNYLNTSAVTNMQDMFAYCYALTNVDVSAFNTSNVTNMQQLFSACKKLTSLDLRNFNTGKVTNMNSMFWSCEDLATIVVGDDWSTAAVTSSDNMFYGCTNIVGSKGTTYDANHIDKEYAHIDGGTSSPGYLSEPIMPYAVYDASTTTLTFAYGPKPAGAYSLNTGTSYPAWYSDGTCSNVTKVFFNPTFADVRPTTTYYWFAGMTNLTSVLGLNNFNTSEVTNMSYMFYACESLTDLDLTSFNTAKVTGMYGMFCACYGLKNLNVSSFNTANVTDMYHMFTACRQLTTLDLSSFNTAKVTDMEEMFYNSTNLVTIKVGNDWSTAAVTSSNNMFKGCTNIKGGAGTTYDANHVDKAYAHIDGGTSNPGYLSAGEYNLWINGTQLTAANAGNLSVIDGVSGTVKYNAGTKTLTLDNATITNTESAGRCIRSEIDGLTIALKGDNTLTADQNSSSRTMDVYTTTITGPGSLEVTSGYRGIEFHAGSTLTIDDVPSLTISSPMVGIYGTGTNGTRLIMKGENTVVNVNVSATSGVIGAIRNIGEFVLEDGLEIVEPVGGYFSGNRLRDAAGNTAKNALIAKRSGLRGDVNGDGKVDVSDVNIVINIMLGKAQASQYPGNADVNNDTKVDVSDVNIIINIMLGKE